MMIRLEVKNCNMALTEKQKEHQHYHQARYIRKIYIPRTKAKNYWWPKIKGRKAKEESYRWSKNNIIII